METPSISISPDTFIEAIEFYEKMYNKKMLIVLNFETYAPEKMILLKEYPVELFTDLSNLSKLKDKKNYYKYIQIYSLFEENEESKEIFFTGFIKFDQETKQFSIGPFPLKTQSMATYSKTVEGLYGFIFEKFKHQILSFNYDFE